MMTHDRFKGLVAILACIVPLSACAGFQEGTPLDAAVDASTGEDMEVPLDMEAPLDVGPSLDTGSPFDMTEPVDMTRPVDAMADASTRTCRDDTLGTAPLLADAVGTEPQCCKVRLLYDADSVAIVYPRNETPLPPNPDDADAYVRIASRTTTMCRSYAIVMPNAGPLVHYTMPESARLYSASFPSSSGVRSECVDYPSTIASRDGVAITIHESCASGTCPSRTRWIATGTTLSIAPPDDCVGLDCLMQDPAYLLMGWKNSSSAECFAGTDPNLGSEAATACPAEGSSMAALADIPDCPTE